MHEVQRLSPVCHVVTHNMTSNILDYNWHLYRLDNVEGMHKYWNSFVWLICAIHINLSYVKLIQNNRYLPYLLTHFESILSIGQIEMLQ